MDKYRVQKLFKGYYQIMDNKNEIVFEGNVAECYSWIRLNELNILEE